MSVTGSKNLSTFFETTLDLNGQLTVDFVSFEMNEIHDFMADKSIRIHTVSATTRGALDLISFLEYGSEDWWWIIALLNKITDPWGEVTPGTDLAIPQPRDVDSYLLLLRDRRRSLGVVNVI